MNDYSSNEKSFTYEGQTLYYSIKDVEFSVHKGIEWATGIMLIFDENHIHKDTFAVSDERNKVLYAMPNDAKFWYEEYKNLNM